MATIAQNLQTIASAKEDIRQAIVDKGVTCGTEVPLTDYATKIGDIPTGGGSSDVPIADDVRFIDYDGTIVHSYSKADFLQLTEMPENPTHTGLTAKGWNWSLSDAKTYVTNYTYLEIGQMYDTSDGKTRIYITLNNSSALSITLYFGQTVSEGVSVDWGDETTPSTTTGTDAVNIAHTYAATGDYTITLSSAAGVLYFGSKIFGTITAAAILPITQKIELGSNCSGISTAFSGTATKTLTIPPNAFSSNSWRLASFSEMYRLVHLTIPTGANKVSTGGAFGSVRSLRSISFPNGFTDASGLNLSNNVCKRITLPATVTTIASMTSFANATLLEQVTLPSITLLYNGNMLGGCYSLKKIYLNPNATVPATHTSFNLTNLSSLEEFSFPNGWTNIASNNNLTYCYNLKKLYLPSSITSIMASFCTKSVSLTDVYLYATTPPTVEATSFDLSNKQFKIHVPASALADYQAATTWSTTYINYLVGDL